MSQVSLLLAGVLWGAMSGQITADRPAVSLENAVLKLEITKSPTLGLSRLIHKKSGTQLLNGAAGKDLFQLTLTGDDGRSVTLESSKAAQSLLASEPIRQGVKAVMSWSKFPGVDVNVRVTASCWENEPLVQWTIYVDNNTGKRLVSVRFPMVMAAPAIGDSPDDFLVLPALPGTLIRNPAENWSAGQSVTLNYPGNLSAQFLSFQDPTAGVYLAGMDQRGHPMALGAAKRADRLMLFHQYEPVGHPRLDWESPYPVGLGVTQGAWYHTADLYKQWAVKQRWCDKTLAQRDDIPAWWKEGPLVHVCEVRTYDQHRVCNGSYYPKLLEHLRALRQKVEGPVVPMLAGWENHRRWTAGDYFPIFDEKEWQRVIPQVRHDGFRPFWYLSGLYYTFRNEGVDGGEIPAAEKFAPYFVIDRETNKPRVFAINESSPNGTWKRHSYEFCPEAAFTKDFFFGVIDQARARGVDVLQMDQTVTGASSPCYATNHGHAPGVGLYQTEAFHDLLLHMRRYGKGKSKDFALFHEEPHEQLIPFLDGFHVREYYEKRWYRGYPGAVGIPLFSYLYHEYAIGYGGDSAGVGKWNDRRLIRAHAVNLVSGRTPGVAIWSAHQAVSEAHPDQIKLLRNHCRLLKTRAKDFLMLGKMLHPYELDVPRLAFNYATDDRKSPPQPIETPAILTSSWQSPAGSVGHLFVNISETKQVLKVAIDTRNAPGWPAADVEVSTSEEGTTFRPLWKAIQLPKEYSRELEPLEVVFVEARRGK